ncbi:MAG: TfuA-like protein [Pseudomonadota bacterium]|nr:TfuA-like protein [Pseudomonadota bacterium]
MVAFAGPSVSPEDRHAFPAVEWRGPAEAGDLLRLAVESPVTVCLIDGYFDHRPAVRHKEVLLLLAEGVPIIGGSSIGALRAAEMTPFGMQGVGAIYRAYADGRIDGDDEVALAHAPEEWGWRPLSVPLVEVRATLCRAVRTGVLHAGEARTVREAAAAIHYVDRTWEALLSAVPATVGGRLRAALPGIEVPLKRLDAIACLKAATAVSNPDRRRPPVVSTLFLYALMEECGINPAARLKARSAAG